ncbi:MAG TPA: hypothetical protein VKC60_12925 [Opitutaceae bacterium]|nr:hypothetical protein [Opitutaceae bacterium]
MDLPLHPQSPVSHLTGHAFADGERVTSYLTRSDTGEVVRQDILATEETDFKALGFVFCSWTHPFKPRAMHENPDRALKLTAENLFVTLADPTTESDPANIPLLQFLALMLERKKILKPRGMTEDGLRNIFAHSKTHQLYEVVAGDLNEEFFIKIQDQLSILVGAPKPKAVAPAAPSPIPDADVPTPT